MSEPEQHADVAQAALSGGLYDPRMVLRRPDLSVWPRHHDRLHRRRHRHIVERQARRRDEWILDRLVIPHVDTIVVS